MIARRRRADFIFSALGMTLVVGSLAVLVALFGSLAKDGGRRLFQTHDVKTNGSAPGRMELVGTLTRDEKGDYALRRPPIQIEVLRDASKTSDDIDKAVAAMGKLVGRKVIAKQDLPEPGVLSVQVDPADVVADDSKELSVSRNELHGELAKEGKQYLLNFPPLPLSMAKVTSDSSGLAGKRVAVETGRRIAVPVRVDAIEELVSKSFFSSFPSKQWFRAGIYPALIGSVLVILITMLVALPLGVMAGVYLEEYGRKNWFTALIEINIANLAGVPSIIWGLMGLGLFIYSLSIGRNVYAAGLTLGLLVLPIVIMATREAIRAIPQAIREASYGCGASKWQTTWYHIIPYSMGGILTGAIIGLSRAIGETAPLITVGAVLYMSSVPSLSTDSPYTVLPIQMFDWTSKPDQMFHRNAAAAGIILLVLTLSMNAIAIVLRYRLRKSIKW